MPHKQRRQLLAGGHFSNNTAVLSAEQTQCILLIVNSEAGEAGRWCLCYRQEMEYCWWFRLCSVICILLPIRGEEICDNNWFRAKCTRNEIIVITHAQYGRMKPGPCLITAGGTCNRASYKTTVLNGVKVSAVI